MKGDKSDRIDTHVTAVGILILIIAGALVIATMAVSVHAFFERASVVALQQK